MNLRLAWKIRQVSFQVFDRYRPKEKLEPHSSFQLSAHLINTCQYLMTLATASSRWILGAPKVLLVFPKILDGKKKNFFFFSVLSFTELSSNFGHVPTVYYPIWGLYPKTAHSLKKKQHKSLIKFYICAVWNWKKLQRKNILDSVPTNNSQGCLTFFSRLCFVMHFDTFPQKLLFWPAFLPTTVFSCFLYEWETTVFNNNWVVDC